MQKGDEDSGCCYFQWFSEEIVDEKGLLIMRQMRESMNLQSSLGCTRRWLKMFIIRFLMLLGINVFFMFIMYIPKAKGIQFIFTSSNQSLLTLNHGNHYIPY